jgi:predicted membrane protein
MKSEVKSVKKKKESASLTPEQYIHYSIFYRICGAFICIMGLFLWYTREPFGIFLTLFGLFYVIVGQIYQNKGEEKKKEREEKAALSEKKPENG